MSKIKKDQHKRSKKKDKYRVSNWPEYNQALINRGNITIYFSPQAVANWHDNSPAQKGGQYVYSDVCIETLLVLKAVFKLGYSQAQGFSMGLLGLMGLDLSVPSYSQLQRRSKTLDVEPYKIPKDGSIVIAVDSTGLKVYGEGEWKVRKHGYSKRRTWRKLHLSCDPKTGFIHCFTLTDNSVDDASQIEPMLEQVDHQVDEACLDGAYDTEDCWDELIDRGIIPPRKNAVEWHETEPGDLPDYPRNRALREIERQGRKKWKEQSGYHKRSLSETAMFRFKTIHGRKLYSRKMETQQTETKMKIRTLNIMTALGMPASLKLKRS